jgi:transposase
MLGMLDHSPDLFLDEIQDQLQCVHGLEISLSTISRTLKRLGMTSKKASCPDTIETQLTGVPAFQTSGRKMRKCST